MNITKLASIVVFLTGPIIACNANAASDVNSNIGINQIRQAVSNTTTSTNGIAEHASLSPQDQENLANALTFATAHPAWKPGRPCLFNCPPPTGAVSASPQQVRVSASGLGSTTIHWTWNEDRNAPVAEYACLWVTTPGDTNAYYVNCEHPGNNYTVNIPWIGVGTYEFFVAVKSASPAPVANMMKIASTTVVGLPQ